MANKLAILSLFWLAGCSLFTGPDAKRTCGEWPYRVLSPAFPEHVQEVWYAEDLVVFEEAPDFFRNFQKFIPWIGFFASGVEFDLLRHGDLSERHVLIQPLERHDLFWTTAEEISC